MEVAVRPATSMESWTQFSVTIEIIRIFWALDPIILLYEGTRLPEFDVPDIDWDALVWKPAGDHVSAARPVVCGTGRLVGL
jgi:hypothetical protein